ncbi:MAG: hypothetical protein JSS20_10255 [Proteobacteria bacterium]|nr:hypothetical protein [Pseudomonadota bacterium]
MTRQAQSMPRVGLEIPIIALVLAATAVPIELRWPTYDPSGFGLSVSIVTDVIANVLGYVPVGAVLSSLGTRRAMAIAAALTIGAETAQLVAVHRDPSVLDVIANLTGAALGVAVAQRWRIALPTLALSRSLAWVAAGLACAVLAAAWVMRAEPPSERGVTLPGRLEANWKLDETGGRIAKDHSGHGLDGRFAVEPTGGTAEPGRSVLFEGGRNFVDLGHPAALRLTGSMTISAWINAKSHPWDDGVVISDLGSDGAGFQLDTTPDAGPRTIGFKIHNDCGQLAARYGATPLATGIWYHIAGVYNAEARTLDVYLDGKLDNGTLFGSVTGAQKSARSQVYIAKRGDQRGYQFEGRIRDVRVYSRALKGDEILSAMAEAPSKSSLPASHGDGSVGTAGRLERSSCSVRSDDEDKHFPILAAAVGMLAAIAIAGLWPAGGAAAWLLASLGAGLLLPWIGLPPINVLLAPLTSLAAGAAVMLGSKRVPLGSSGELGH